MAQYLFLLFTRECYMCKTLLAYNIVMDIEKLFPNYYQRHLLSDYMYRNQTTW
jgi:hypothetical protein